MTDRQTSGADLLAPLLALSGPAGEETTTPVPPERIGRVVGR